MGHEIFISHSTDDHNIAIRICGVLEAMGLSCWIAPRDIKAGTDWGESIIDGIVACKVLLLVFSRSSNGSPHVQREIERAASRNRRIVVFRLENENLSKGLEYFLSGSQWFDATSGALDDHILNLAERIGSFGVDVDRDRIDPTSIELRNEPIPHLEVEVKPFVMASPRSEVLPEISSELLALEGEVKGLEWAIEQLDQRIHPSLRPLLQVLELAERQLRSIQRNTDACALPIPAELRAVAANAIVGGVDRAGFDAQARSAGVPAVLILRYFEWLQLSSQAQKNVDASRDQIASQISESICHLQSRLKPLLDQLISIQLGDFSFIVRDFVRPYLSELEFPIARWVELKAEIAHRRYRFVADELDRTASAVFEEELARFARETPDKEMKQRFAARVLRQADQEAWQRALRSNTTAAFEEYLRQNPVGVHVDEAHSAIADRRNQPDNDAWEAARSIGSRNSIREYLRHFPGGRHIEEARRHLEQIASEDKHREHLKSDTQREEEAWNMIRKRPGFKRLRCYLREWPSGPHADEVLRLFRRTKKRHRIFLEILLCASAGLYIYANDVYTHWPSAEEIAVAVRDLRYLITEQKQVASGIIHASNARATDFPSAQSNVPITLPFSGTTNSLLVAPASNAIIAALTITNEATMKSSPPSAPLQVLWTNSLGMPFVDIPGIGVKFCIWPVRLRDYESFKIETNAEWPFPGIPQGRDHPVVMVSWVQAMSYCDWLTKKERKEGVIKDEERYRLPTDYEWSVAVGLAESPKATPKAKDGVIRGIYPWGNTWPPPPGAGNYLDRTYQRQHRDSAPIPDYDDGFADTSPVGTYKPNRFGLYDMGGNVWQWCMDVYDPDSTNATTRAERVIRGASFESAQEYMLLASYRASQAPDHRSYFTGFRCVLGREEHPLSNAPATTQTPLDIKIRK